MIYTHYKNGKQYEVVGHALQTETGEELVIYKPLYECEHDLFARPKSMFYEIIEHNGEMIPRFRPEKIS